MGIRKNIDGWWIISQSVIRSACYLVILSLRGAHGGVKANTPSFDHLLAWKQLNLHSCDYIMLLQ